MDEHRMEHGNHKAAKPHEPSDAPQASVPRDRPAEPTADAHEPLDRIPANEGGTGGAP